ncbi:MAG: hypothetical protein GY759_10340 [Chloroflexi bacterium]|nr:hypothetical protein [Chloroflexota bacterium]
MMKYLSAERLKQVFERCTDLKIGVIGDLGLDAYWYADMTHSFLSRETPLYPRPVVREAYTPGAGANVADNLKALGVGQVTVFTVLGDDWRGEMLRRVLSQRDIIVEHLIISSHRSTTTYIKPMLMGYDSQQEDARLDFENVEPLAVSLEEALIDSISTHVSELDACVIADQLDANGIVTGRVREGLNRLAAENPDKFFVVDSRQRIALYRNMVLKPNWVEAAAALHPDRDPRSMSRDELTHIGKTLSRQCHRPVFITLSERGVLACSDGTHRFIAAAPVHPPLDPVGAGDSFIAALTTALTAGATPWEAGNMANLAAAVTVEKLNQTGAASPDEILARAEEIPL